MRHYHNQADVSGAQLPQTTSSLPFPDEIQQQIAAVEAAVAVEEAAQAAEEQAGAAAAAGGSTGNSMSDGLRSAPNGM